MVIHYKAARARENFPVASALLPARARGVILALYDFARGADDIADSADLSEADKRDGLQRLDKSLLGEAVEIPSWAHAYRDYVLVGEADAQHGRDLLCAFLQDASKQRYAKLDELVEYCRYSAAPVGRAVLAACGEEHADIVASDALCGALQLINHLQDIGEDYRALDRIYLPQDVLQHSGASDAMLGLNAMRSEVKPAMQAVLLQSERWVMQSAHLAGTLRSKRLRLEIATIWQIAELLNARLRSRDPLAQRVKLSRLDYTACVIRAIPSLWMLGNKQ